MAQSGDASRPSVSGRAAAGIGAAVALVVLALVVYGGYGEHWRWVGVNGATATLWDWLHLLLLPIAAVVLPLWLRHRPQMSGAVMTGGGGARDRVRLRGARPAISCRGPGRASSATRCGTG